MIFIVMGKEITKKIKDCKLVKVEKLYNQAEKQKFYYNLELDGIEELLLIESNTPIPPGISGYKIKYKLSDTNEVSQFQILL